MKKKLLFVINQLFKGGAEVSLVNLINNINYNQYEVDLIILDRSKIANTISLVNSINSRVNIIDDALEKPLYDKKYVKNKHYDWAFHIGEWHSPEFVAKHVSADYKAVWIHTDLSKSTNFNDITFFHYIDYFQYCIFVSLNALAESLKVYPFLKNKSYIIKNICDFEQVRLLSEEKVDDVNIDSTKTLLITCANVREEKNYKRSIEVMRILKDKGLSVQWLNIGSTANDSLTKELKTLIKVNGLENDYIFIGAQNNPYKYIKHADALIILSDYESWSIVITEALILGVPVITTPTAGGKEQIIDGINGIITSFETEEIAGKIYSFISNRNLRQKIKKNIELYHDNKQEIISSFNLLIENQKQENTSDHKILYVIDDINYQGGAHVATKNLIKLLLKNKMSVTIYTTCRPSIEIRNDLAECTFIYPENLFIFDIPLKKCLLDRDISIKNKIMKLKAALLKRITRRTYYHYQFNKITNSASLNNFKTICILSQASIFREYFSSFSNCTKVQWIHTDYVNWLKVAPYSKGHTIKDNIIYKEFDKIVVLSDKFKSDFIRLYPNLENKLVINKNIIKVPDIPKKKATKKIETIKFITVGRIDDYKGHFKLLEIFHQLNMDGYNFEWTVVGTGPNEQKLKHKINNYNLDGNIKMIGHVNNPHEYIIESDVFILISEYEGLPNVIYESLILGVPVIASNVGAIDSQIKHKENGWLVNGDIKSTYKLIRYLIMHPEEIELFTKNLENYVYDNKSILEKNIEILTS